MLVLLSLASAAFAQDTGAPANPGHLALLEWLDDTYPFCADVIGGTPEPGKILQTHDCHDRMGVIPEDQEFTTNYPDVGSIYLTQADLCIAAGRLVAGSRLVVSECSATDRRQRWVSTEDGQIHPASNTDLCWAMETRPSGTSHKRELTLETCADVEARFVTWSIPGGSVGS
jgi:hypothetical protein